MTSQELAAIAGILLSLGFSYIPGLREWFDALDATKKRLVMIGLLFAIALGAFGLACAGLGAELGISVTCDQPGALGLLREFFIAVVANQATFLIAPKRARNYMRG